MVDAPQVREGVTVDTYPPEEHLALIGRAHWAWSRLEWSLIDLATPEQDREKRSDALAAVAKLTGGCIVKKFLEEGTVTLPPSLRADLYKLVGRRNDLAHSRPSSPVYVEAKLIEFEEGLLRLNRWDPEKQKMGEFLTDDWLRKFIADCERHLAELQLCS